MSSLSKRRSVPFRWSMLSVSIHNEYGRPRFSFSFSFSGEKNPKMHRLSSSCRVSEEFFINSSSPSQSLSSKQQSSETVQLNPERLPTYNSLSYTAKKERSRLRSAENAVHIIPLVLVLCAIVLWFFSSPESRV